MSSFDNKEVRLRIQYFPPTDFAHSVMVQKSLALGREFDWAKPQLRVNDLLKCLNASRYFEDLLKYPNSFEYASVDLETFIRNTKQSLGKKMSVITAENLEHITSEIEPQYHRDFLEWLFKAQKALFHRTNVVVKLFIGGVPLSELVRSAGIRDSQDQYLVELYIQNPGMSAELIIAAEFGLEGRPSHIPSGLTYKDADTILRQYLKLGSGNMDYVRVVAETRKKRSSYISSNTTRLYRQQYSSRLKELFQEGGEQIGVEIQLVDDLQEIFSSTFNDGVELIKIDRSYLRSDTSERSVLDNFVYIAGVTTADGILAFPFFEANSSVFETVIGLNPEEFYGKNLYFTFTEMKFNLLVAAYAQFLEIRDSSLEDVFTWFFATYLREEFGIENFAFSPPPRNSTILERCKSMLPEIESAVRQYRCLVEESVIDHELIELDPRDVDYRQIPSLLKDKYLIANGYECRGKNVLNLLFSPQSCLLLIENTNPERDFAELLCQNAISISDFQLQEQKVALRWLQDLGLIEVSRGLVTFSHWLEIDILRRVFQHGATIVLNLYADEEAAGTRLVTSGILSWNDALMTEDEGRYFDYCLNDKFRNALSLRNIVLHGGMRLPDAEQRLKHAYVVSLKLMVGLIVKINDELCAVQRAKTFRRQE